MGTWKGFSASSWTFSKSRIIGHGGGIGDYQAAYAVAVADGVLLNGRVSARIRLTDRYSTGAGLVCRADENWTFIAFYIAPDEQQEGATRGRIAAYREGLFIPVAQSEEPIQLKSSDNIFSLEFYSGQIRGEILAGDQSYELMATCPHVPSPGYAGFIKFYRATLVAQDFIIEKTEMPFTKTSEPKEKFDYDVFLCHSKKDKETVEKLAKQLAEAGVRYWLDAEQIKYGDPIVQKIEDGLRRSRYLVPCVSVNLKSGWSRAEYSAILSAELSGDSSTVVIPVVLDEISVSEIPPLLRDKRRISYTNKVEFSEFLQFLRNR